ncbi:type I-B CRISPR-associated protein Cas7/Csh2 [Methanofollis fontis]|uniref:Type I-B CRISPR-associated protein Cas7/Csh2 n=1 Tax=Methanofollis fontis TaxID=2052832 RepID=A0A483CS07_9EURY|nr:type I-B CRISPR-associated protein Cas7/Csh2 [Methanofollis fontis]TAJ45001.1 type I-B CRISPR-associated protein Cas7/Csh2 [Methanofollis fontis]
METKTETIKNRSELIFLYDIKWGNPNGDPMDENRPRFDEERSVAIVTDVRLKRTVRDYLQDVKGQILWVSGDPVTPKKRAEELQITSVEDAVSKCIDVRLFGVVIPAEGRGTSESSLTGPVQFRFGRTLNKTRPVYMQGTAAFASDEKDKQRSFRDDHMIPYGLIAFYGIINQNAAKATGMSDEDRDALLDGIWNGTRNLITRSKMEQLPRFLLNVVYKEGNYHIGELDAGITISVAMPEEDVRSIAELTLNFDGLAATLVGAKDQIERIEYRYDKRIQSAAEFVEIMENEKITVEELIDKKSDLSSEQEKGEKDAGIAKNETPEA